MGRIAAGTPISALQTRSHSISLPPDLLSSGEHYALEVRGDSMIEAGILDGDTVVIKKQDTAESGEIVVALIDEEEATLKRLRKRGASSPWKPPILPMRHGFSDPIGSTSRASWSVSCANIDSFSSPRIR